MHPSTRDESVAINALHSAARDSFRKNSLKRCIFVCEGKITLFSFPKVYRITWTVDAVFFFRSAMEFHKCVCWRTFYKPGPGRCWICTSFDTERWSSPSYKSSRSWFRTTDGKWNASNLCVFLVIALRCSSLFSSAHGTPPGARLFSERIINVADPVRMMANTLLMFHEVLLTFRFYSRNHRKSWIKRYKNVY